MADDELDITDISNSPAFLELNELLSNGTLTQAQVEFYKSKYAKLHEVVLQKYENEKNLLRKAKELNDELRKERLASEEIVGRDKEIRDELDHTRTEFAKAEAEVVMCEERDAMLMLEVAELERQKDEITKEKEDKEREAIEALRPRLEALNLHIQQLTQEIDSATTQSQKLLKEKGVLEQKAVSLEEAVKTLSAEVEEQRQTMIKVKSEPGKVKKQIDVAESSLTGYQNELKAINKTIVDLDKTLKEQSEKRQKVEDERDELSLLRSRHNDAIEQKLRIKQEQERDLQEQKNRKAQIQEESLRLDIDQRNMELEHKRANDVLQRAQREKEDEIKRYRKAEVNLAALKSMIPALGFQKEDVARTIAQQKIEKRDQLKRLEELNRDIDVFINDFLSEESLERDKAAALAALLRENKELESELGLLVQQVQSLEREAAELSARRDAKARELAKAVANRREALEDMKMKDIVILDLSKRSLGLSQQLKDYTKLYEAVKNERNKAVNMIQASQQAAAEMKEKIGILQNEVEILQNESAAKDKAVAANRQQGARAVAERDSVRSEVNRLLFAYREKQESIDQKIAEIDKLNSIINGVERDMVRLKRQYEQAVEERNYTGIQLIDRNDELCILYEKCNIQEQILRNGELELRARDEEMRVLRLELGRYEWLLGVTTKLLPKLPKFRTEIDALRAQLEEERKRTEQLGFELESPANTARFRLLGGKDLSPAEMKQRILQLEDRLNHKKEQLLEKELVLEEVGGLSERLRGQAAEGRAETLDVAKAVNEMQGRLKSITRKLMACVSELSMYQATAMRLEQDRDARAAQLAEAHRRLEAGEAPTDDAEVEWDRAQRRREMRREMIARRQEEARLAAAGGGDAPQTTAVPRPNAYMPEDIALPRPYGAQAPFRPSEPGATMRHIVKPQPREIEI